VAAARLLLLAAIGALFAALAPVQAQTLVREFKSADAGKNVIMSADSLTYDEARGIVTATGNVEIGRASCRERVWLKV
jgi:lipopolysaccharide assembly outer membrane protein LptD (OstA)